METPTTILNLVTSAKNQKENTGENTKVKRSTATTTKSTKSTYTTTCFTQTKH